MSTPISQQTIGAARVTRVEEMAGPGFRLSTIFPDWDGAVFEEHKDWLVPTYVNPAKMTALLNMHSWIVEHNGLTVLIDTCVGNDKDRMPAENWTNNQGPYLQRLAEAGFQPEDIDMVMCTHLHVDHVGWNTKLLDGRWVPTFPNAKYLFSRVDFEHYQDHAVEDMDRLSFVDSVLPIVEHGLAEMTEGDHLLAEGLLLEPAPGHTPGHITLKLESEAEAAIFTGDILHHPLQVYHPEWNSRFCLLPDEARTSRRRVLDYCADRGALLMPAHFGAPHCCHIDRAGEAYSLRWHHG
ncbi:MAG: MBL fold metallo-hydrolase [Alphaproteobacteria bacterium]|nr:MBL fold metallo-hydrolase [Alphaproteobacteria bacterium]